MQIPDLTGRVVSKQRWPVASGGFGNVYLAVWEHHMGAVDVRCLLRSDSVFRVFFFFFGYQVAVKVPRIPCDVKGMETAKRVRHICASVIDPERDLSIYSAFNEN